MNDQPTMADADVRSSESVTFQQSIVFLRAQGCACPLHWDPAQQSAVPHTPGDAVRCVYHRTKGSACGPA